MHRKNNLFSICIITVIFFIGCSDDKTQLISNTPADLPDQNYKINLQSNSGSFLETVTIYWNGIEGEVELMDSNTPIIPNGNSHLFNLEPGEFRDISIQVIIDDSTYMDTIQIFTRPIYPVTNFEFEVEQVMRGNKIWDEGESYTDSNEDGIWNAGEEFVDIEYPKYHRNLTWSATDEPSENFLNYTIYRTENVNADILINPTNCNCEIISLSLAYTSYTDSTVQEESGLFAYFYQVQVTTGNGSRNSYIYNYTNFTSPSKISLDNSNVSTNNNEFIQITWDPVSNSTYFYQYEIWRAPDEELSDTTLLAIITNHGQEKFMDRNVGNGTTWYYSAAVVDINGQRKFSNYIPGWSMP